MWSAHTGWAYNLSVQGIHTYHIGHHEILVHNTGCDVFSARLQKEIGGEIKTFRPPGGAPFLGGYRLGPVDEAWGHHTVVVKGGRVFDQYTGRVGMDIGEWKKQWTYADAIDFGC